MIPEEKKKELKTFMIQWLQEKQKVGELPYILTKPEVNKQYVLTPSLYKLNMELMPVSDPLTQRNIYIRYQILLREERGKYIARYMLSCMQTECMSLPLKNYFKETLLPEMNNEWRPRIKDRQYYDYRLSQINEISGNMRAEELRAFLEDGYREGLAFEKKLKL